MQNRFTSYLVVGCIGGTLGWIANARLQQHESPASASPATRSVERAISPALSEADSSARTQPTRDVQSATHDSSTTSEASEEVTNAPQSAVFGDALALPSDDRNKFVAGDSADKDPLADLSTSMKIWCRFESGNGAWLKADRISLYDLAYQGGPIGYDAIDIGAGTARMTGSEGATASQEGVLDALVSATRTGLHFSAFNARGELVVTTVFAGLDNQGRHLSVMTTHGARALDGSFQTYGACDTGSARGVTARDPRAN